MSHHHLLSRLLVGTAYWWVPTLRETGGLKAHKATLWPSCHPLQCTHAPQRVRGQLGNGSLMLRSSDSSGYRKSLSGFREAMDQTIGKNRVS